MNQVIITGNLGRDVEVGNSQTGTAYCRATVAVSDGYKDKAGVWQEKTHWVNLIAFGKVAEQFSALKRGDSCMIDGSLNYEQWQDQSGKNRSALSVRVGRFFKLERKAKGQDQHPTQQDNGYNADW